MLEFTRTVFTKTTLKTIYERSESEAFAVLIECTNNNEWWMSLIDFDDSIGALACFDSEQQALDWADRFVETALPLYDEKIAKYKACPTLRVENDQLVLFSSFNIDFDEEDN